MQVPRVEIDLQAFWDDPYPVLEQMRRQTPIGYVPQLDATLITKRDDIFVCEKNVAVFSSEQPGGLMTRLMGENMMRKDGAAHIQERQQMQPSVSPAAVKKVWTTQFRMSTDQVLNELETRGADVVDLVTDYALPVSAHALRHITGLVNLTIAQMDAVSQGMIDGVANYTNDKAIEAKCVESTTLIDTCIDEMLKDSANLPSSSILNTLVQSGQAMDSVRANVKLAISGGQNEPRDAIAGTVWALLKHPEQLSRLMAGEVAWLSAFEEYARWLSPIGMSPRRIAQDHEYNGITFKADSRAFLMFSSGNRDEDTFENADQFDISRNTSKAISFGAGPHFCAGAAASRSLIGEVALPKLFERFPKVQLAGEASFGGWAFRGPLSVPVTLSP